MIALHRLGHQVEEFWLNPDLIVTVDATPDTVLTLTTGTKIVVAEPAQRVVDKVHQYRASVLAKAMGREPRLTPQALDAARSTPVGEAAHAAPTG